VEHRTEHPFLGQVLATEGSTSDATVRVVEQETGRILARAVEAATALIGAHRKELDLLFEHLLTHEMVERDELVGLLGPPMHGPEPPPRADPRPDANGAPDSSVGG
jgi:ATP-dependent Zn protease